MVTRKDEMEMWFNIQYYTYLLLSENTDYREFKKKLPEFIDKYMGENLTASGGKLDCFLQPLTSIHLHSNLIGEIGVNGSIDNVYLFSVIALFILGIACLNFINLSTAASAKRAREVGLRKTLGAKKSELVRQFLSESVIYSIIAFILGYVLIQLMLPLFNSLAGRELTMNFSHPAAVISAMIGFIIITGLAAGLYPALFLASFISVKTLKGIQVTGSSNSFFRRTLVIIQFTISIGMIIGTITIYRQIQFMKNKQLGFNKEQVLIITGINKRIRNSLDTVKDEFKNVPGVMDVGVSSFVPSRGIRMAITNPEGFAENQPQTVNILDIDSDYIPTMQMEIVGGRNFSGEMPTDVAESILINQTCAEKFGWDEPLGKTISMGVITDTGNVDLTRTVIGVVKDYHHNSLHSKIEPVVIGTNSTEFRAFSLRLSPVNISGTMDLLKEKWKEIDPTRPFSYFFLDEAFDGKYRAEERLKNISLSFSALAIFIGCLGLFGMSLHMAEQRSKEIGIRKVLGSTVAGIIGLMSKEFIILTIVASVIASPIAWYLMNKWLMNFAYKTEISVWIFVAAGLSALVVSLVTVSFQSIKAALADPVKSLRYE